MFRIRNPDEAGHWQAADMPAGWLPAGGSICLDVYNREKLEKLYNIIFPCSKADMFIKISLSD